MEKIKNIAKQYLQAMKDVILGMMRPASELSYEECLMRGLYLNTMVLYAVASVACLGGALLLHIWEPVLLMAGVTILALCYMAYTEVGFRNGKYRFIYAICENRSAATGFMNKNSILYHFSGRNEEGTVIGFYLTRQNMTEFVLGQEYLLCFNRNSNEAIGDESYMGRIAIQEQLWKQGQEQEQQDAEAISAVAEAAVAMPAVAAAPVDDVSILDEALQMNEEAVPDPDTVPANALKFEMVNGRPTISPAITEGET